jgi:choline kinase
VTAPYQAIILAAGRGSRLTDQTARQPKALLPIGPRRHNDATQTSFLRRQVELLQASGVEQVVVVIGYLREQIATEVSSWPTSVELVVNTTQDIRTSGSLHSFQHAICAHQSVLDGRHQTLLMDADIVYHRDVLSCLLATPEVSTLLVCDRFRTSEEEVLVYGTTRRPRYLGKGLTPELVDGAPCLGEATGIVKFGPRDHAVVRRTIDWLLGNPDAPEGSLEYRGFGPARRLTEHEELTDRLMRSGRMQALTFPGDELPFLEVDTAEEYRMLRTELYPRLLAMEARS